MSHGSFKVAEIFVDDPKVSMPRQRMFLNSDIPLKSCWEKRYADSGIPSFITEEELLLLPYSCLKDPFENLRILFIITGPPIINIALPLAFNFLWNFKIFGCYWFCFCKVGKYSQL